MTNPIYNADYFIAKFTAIPEELWCENDYEKHNGQRCVMGHCGKDLKNEFGDTEESKALRLLLDPTREKNPGHAEDINNGLESYLQPTPRARILAALNDIKAKEGK